MRVVLDVMVVLVVDAEVGCGLFLTGCRVTTRLGSPVWDGTQVIQPHIHPTGMAAYKSAAYPVRNCIVGTSVYVCCIV